jgi:alkanesulfonate monooxygenase SsuD/methylene tetrahydromethanopterin reductase-like flavin-dependent oxidoreductase (luciferase family)
MDHVDSHLSECLRQQWNKGQQIGDRPLSGIATFAARYADAGCDGVGIHDQPSSGRDAYLTPALVAQATHRLRLFPAISRPVVRHPLVLASLAHSLEEIAPRPAHRTMAPGFIPTRSIGQPRAGRPFIRAAIRDVRRLLAGELAAWSRRHCARRFRGESRASPPPRRFTAISQAVYSVACGGRGARSRIMHGRFTRAPGRQKLAEAKNCD